MKNLVLAVAGVLACAGTVNATIVTFMGEDLNSSNTVRVAHPNSDAARNNFFSNLTNVGTETFESYANGTGVPLAVNFPGAGTTATLTGNGTVQQVLNPLQTNGAGRYPISGTNFWGATANNNFVITFSNPIAAFGFYGVDVGDFGGLLTLGLSGGGFENVNVGNTAGSGGSTDGSVLYFGLIRDTGGITSISFTNSSSVDIFAFDDFSVGSLEQVNLVPLPPAAWAGLGSLAGVAGFGMIRRRKNAAL